MLDIVWLFFSNHREKSDSGSSSYSSMEAPDVSSSSLVSDACLQASDFGQDRVVFPFERVKDEGPEASAVAASTGDIPRRIGGAEGSSTRMKLLEVSPEHLSHDHRRISLPSDVPRLPKFSFIRNKLSSSARNFFSSKGSNGSSNSSSSSESRHSVERSLESLDRLSQNLPKDHKSSGPRCRLLSVSTDYTRRARSAEPEGRRKKPERWKLDSSRRPGDRRSPLEIIRSSLHLDRSPIRPTRKRSPSECSPLGAKNEKDFALSFDPEISSLKEVRGRLGMGSVLSLPEGKVPEERESVPPLSGSIPMVVVHCPQTSAALSGSSSCDLPHVISSSRTSPAPLTDLFQDGSEALPIKPKQAIQRVASMDSAKTMVQSHGVVDTATTGSELDAKNSDGKSSPGPLHLPLASEGRVSPRKFAGKSSSSGDASIKFGKSSSSSSESKKKKTSSWYNPKKIVLSPSYKSRSEDFKRIFKGLPSTERLIVEYSCALQKDILIQGRMYVSQSWICFYANIFRWETILMIRCKDIVKLTKEKTARVIPNAIQICTRNDRYFFASFGARDKVFVQLDLIRKNAINEVQMNKSEFWSWVHFYYGDDLGLTSDDDDYMPVTPEDKSKFQAFLQNELVQSQEGISIEIAKDALEDPALSHSASTTSSAPPTFAVSKREVAEVGGRVSSARREGSPSSFDSERGLPIEMEAVPTESASSEEDEDDEEIVDYCASHSHFAIDVLDEAFNMSVDDIFHHCFSDSQIYKEFVEAKKTFNVKLNPWTRDSDANGGQKVRNISYTLTLDFSIGPKHSPSTEKQIMHEDSQPGRFYLIDTECFNEGIPYGENFFITNRYCISRLSAKRSRLKITSQINYRKNVWGFIKNFLEKNVTAGIISSFNVLADLIRLESDRQLIPMATASSQLQHSLSRNKFMRRRRACGVTEGVQPQEAIFVGQSHPSTPVKPGSASHSRTSSISRFKTGSEGSQPITVDSLVCFVCTVLMVLMMFNGMLFYKLWSLESTATGLLNSKFLEHQQQQQLLHDSARSHHFAGREHHHPGQKGGQSRRIDGRRAQATTGSGKHGAWSGSDVDQWKNVLLTSIRLMDHMRASLVELRNNIIALERSDREFAAEKRGPAEERSETRNRG